MLILIMNIGLTPIAFIADSLNVIISFLKWDARFIDNNTDSTKMMWDSDVKKPIKK